MRNLALAVILIALGAIGAASPSFAATGQCFDAYGRPVGPPHNTDNPPYGLICSVYRAGGTCTHVQPQWADNNCGYRPRQSYYNYERPRYQDYERPRYPHSSYYNDERPCRRHYDWRWNEYYGWRRVYLGCW